MATQRDLIENAVKEALEQIQKNAPAEYAKLNAEPAQKEKVINAAKAAASETLKLNAVFAGKPENIEERLAKHLPDDRIQLIKEGLKISTFRLEFAKNQDVQLLKCTREGKQFLPVRELASIGDINWGKKMQYTSILVEAILLALSVTGISPTPSGEAIYKACTEILGVIESSSAMIKALEDFVKVWNAAGGGATGYFEKAKALLFFLKAIYTNCTDIYWNVVKIVCSGMSLFDWMNAFAQVTAMLVCAFATEGFGLIAKLVSAMMSDVKFARKIANINQFFELQKSM